MPWFHRHDDRPAEDRDELLRALEQAMAGGPAPREDLPRQGPPMDEVLQVVVTESRPAAAREAIRPMVASGDTRVWDVCRPYLIPAALTLAVGLLLVSFLTSSIRWFLPGQFAPSQQERFDAEWNTHRPETDEAPPEKPAPLPPGSDGK